MQELRLVRSLEDPEYVGEFLRYGIEGTVEYLRENGTVGWWCLDTSDQTA